MIAITAPRGRRWYLVRTVRYGERDAVSAIEELELETYLPRETHFARHGRRIRRVSLPLFRGYVFTRFDIERDAWGGIRRAQSVDDIVSANEVPLRVPDRQVDTIRRLELAGAYDATRITEERNDFPAGAKVRITMGPFAGKLATVSRLAPKERIEVLFSMLGRRTPMQIERAHLVRV